MTTKTAKDADSEAASKDQQQQQPANDQGLATREGAQVVQDKAGDVSGPLSAILSQEMRDSLSLELQEALHQIETGFGTLTAPGEVYKMQTPFHVIDAITINDYLDRATGEEKVKHIFRLELEDGRVLATMQSDARPRRVLASAYTKARALGARLKCGPFLYEKKRIEGQIQDAFIFTQQKGFKAEAY